MTTNLDLTRPEHRGRVAWAASVWARDPDEARHRLAGPWLSHPEFDLDRAALGALSSPSDSAAIVRALMEGCGLVVTLGHPFDARLDETAAAADIHVMVPAAMNAVGIRRRTSQAYQWLDNIPALVLRLLACTTREEALAALREARR